MLDIGTFTWGPSSEYPSSRDPSSIAGRYAAPGQDHQAGVVDRASSRDVAADMRHVAEGAQVPTFLIRDVPKYRAQISRAIADDDADAVTRLVGEIDDFTGSHLDEITAWASAGGDDPALKGVAQNAQQLLAKTYKASWAGPVGGQQVSVDAFLDDSSEEAKARRADRMSRELNVDAGAARALFDRDSPMFPALGQFRAAVMARPAQNETVKDSSARQAAKDNFKDAVRFTQEFVGPGDDESPRFATAADAGDFLAAYNARFNADNTVSGLGLMRSTARAFLRSGETDAAHFLARLHEFRDAVRGTGSGGSDDKTNVELRGGLHETNQILSAYLDECDRMAGGAPLDRLHSAALADAAGKVSMLSSVLGIDLRAGEGGLSRRIAQKALKSTGVVGVDDDGIFDLAGRLMAFSDMYKGSDGPPVPAKTKDGQQYMRPADGMFQDLETAVGRAATQRFYQLWRSSSLVDRQRGAGAALDELSRNKEWQAKLKEAVKAPLRSWFSDERAVDIIADEIYLNPVSQAPKTIYQAYLDRSGVLDANGEAKVPVEFRVKPSAAASGAQGDKPDVETIRALSGNPSAVVPRAADDKMLSFALSRYAGAVMKDDSASKGKTDSSRYNRAESVGDLVLASVPEIAAENMYAAQTVPGAVRLVESGDYDKAVKGSRKVAADLDAMAEGVRSGDPDALLAAALVVSKNPEWAAHARQPSVGAPSSFIGGAVFFRREDLRSAGERAYDVLMTALADQGYQVQNKDDVSKVLDIVTTQLAAKGQLNDTVLVASGYLDPKDRSTSEFRVLKQLQDKSYTDPGTTKPVKLSPDRKALDRAFAPLLNESKAYQEVFRRISSYYRGYGMSDADLAAMQGPVMRKVHAAYRDGGAAQALRVGANVEMYEPVFLPEVQVAGGTAYKADGRYRWAPGLYTKEDADKVREAWRKEAFDKYGVVFSAHDLDEAQLKGPAYKRDTLARTEAAARAGMIKAAQNAAPKNGSESEDK